MKLMALFYFVLSLLGVDVGASTFVHRTVSDGADVLYSKATVQAGVARFECLVSISGSCHYTVLPSHCSPGGTPDDGCHSEPIEQFALATGGDRQITGLNDFRLCVSTKDRSPEPEGCQRPELIVAH